ncbi:SRPBCC domain-containing protein [Haladaptatus sp. DFWS20]|uniref:SRPBCC domain-containing protein n=1 Tax=Haladaptatus sp. DFWS20 TaxID=3403467 RepID=UPI003EB9CABA
MQASPEAIYQAFAEPGAMERWLPPGNMTGEMLHFDFREGSTYRMRLTYKDQQAGQGKTSEAFDEMEVRLPRLEPNHRIEQEVLFESDDPAFEGTMRMVWTFEPADSGTIVTVRAENVPAGIQPENHEAGMKSTLDNLTAFVEQDG